MRTLDAVFLDLDGTLLGFDDIAYNGMMAGVCASLGETYGIDAGLLHREHWQMSVARWRDVSAGVFRSSTGAVDGESIMIEIWQEALAAVGCSDPRAARDGFAGYWLGRHVTYYRYEETLEVLGALHGRVPLAVITNGPLDIQLDKLETSGLSGYFDAVISSGHAGVAKPDPAIFRLALEKVGAHPARAWHAGDSLHADVGGALATGLNAAWVNRNAAVRAPHHAVPHAEMTTLRGLLKVLQAP